MDWTNFLKLILTSPSTKFIIHYFQMHIRSCFRTYTVETVKQLHVMSIHEQIIPK